MSSPTLLAAGSMLDCSHLELVEAAAAAGFDGVGLRVSEHDSPRSLRDVSLAARDSGLAINEVEVHRIGTDTIPVDQLLECAVVLGAEHCLVVSDLRDQGATTEALASINQACRNADVGLVIEYMAWTKPSDPQSALAIATGVGCGVVVDLLHHIRVGAGPAELSALVAAGVLSWVQLCDAPIEAPGDLLAEARHQRLLPGEGHLPLAALMGTLPASVPVSVEVQSDELLSVQPLQRAKLLFDAATRTTESG